MPITKSLGQITCVPITNNPYLVYYNHYEDLIVFAGQNQGAGNYFGFEVFFDQEYSSLGLSTVTVLFHNLNHNTSTALVYQNSGTFNHSWIGTNYLEYLDTYRISVVMVTSSMPECNTFNIKCKIWNYIYNQVVIGPITQIVKSNGYVNASSTNAERVTAIAVPELIIQDHRNDIGNEPFLPNLSLSNLSSLTQSPAINNRLFDDNGVGFYNPRYSIATPKNPNYLYVTVTNKSCVSTPATDLNLYWTIARFHEPWAHDWRNFNRGSHFSNNKVLYNSNYYPMGNELNLTPPIDVYSNSVQTIDIPALNGGTKHIAESPWIVPNPDWYKNGTYTYGVGQFPIQYDRIAETPVICLLARLDETWKVDNGYHTSISENSLTDISAYVNSFNNVATLNTFISNIQGGYMWQPTDGNPRGRSGLIAVNPPPGNDPDPIHIGIICDTNRIDANNPPPTFTDHGQINLYLDKFLWDRWVSGGMEGRNIEVIDDQIIKVTNTRFASLENITLEEDELAWLAVETEYYDETPPENDFEYAFSVGSLDLGTDLLIGSPTTFFANVLSDPQIAEEDEFEFTTTTNKGLSNSENVFKLFPNPVDKILYISNLNINGKIQNIQLYNLQGQLVRDFNIINNTDKKLVTLQMDDLISGVYFVSIVADTKYQVFRLLKK